MSTAGLRDLTDRERTAVTMFHNDEPLELIKDQTGLTRSQIAAAVGQARALAEQTPVPAAPPATKPAATPRVPQTQPRPAPAPARIIHVDKLVAVADVSGWTLEQLLQWADEDGNTRPRSLAARIRLAANDLRGLAGRDGAVRDAEAKIETLTAQLAAAREQLRLARGGKLAPSSGTTPAATIRAWAAENDIDCPALGVIPKRVREAFEAAHAESEG